MAPRLDLQAILVSLLGSGNVYFSPPENIKMEYPCIIYNRDRIDTKHADNKPYKHEKRYLVTVVDRDPDSEIPDKVAALPKCSYSRFYTAANLNHDVFTIFF